MKQVKHRRNPVPWRSGEYEYTSYFDNRVYHTVVVPCQILSKGSTCLHHDCRCLLIEQTRSKFIADRLRINAKIRGELSNWWRFTRNENPKHHPRRVALARHIKSIRARQTTELEGCDYTAGIYINVFL